MRLALFLDDSGAFRDAYSVIAAALIPRLREAGDEVVLLRSRPGPGVPFRSELHGVRCYSLGLWGRPWHRWLSALQAAWVLRRERAELAHLHFSGVDGWGFGLARRLLALPFVLTFHSFDARRHARRGPREARRLERLLREAGGVTAVSAAVTAALAEVHPWAAAKVRVVPNGVEASPESASAGRGPFVLSAGALSFEKGTDLLLFAWHDLRRRGLSLPALVLCGQDDKAGVFRDLVLRLGLGDLVTLTGPVPQPRLRALMARCLFYVCPSREESFGMAVLEALAAGRAVIAPRVGGVEDYLDDGKNGLLFEPGDADGLGRALERLLADPGLRAGLASEGPSTAARYPWGAAVEAYRRAQAAAAGPR